MLLLAGARAFSSQTIWPFNMVGHFVTNLQSQIKAETEADFKAPAIEGKVYGSAKAEDFKRGASRSSGTFRRRHLRLISGGAS